MHQLIQIAYIRDRNDPADRIDYRGDAENMVTNGKLQYFKGVCSVADERARYGSTLPNSAADTGVITDPDHVTDCVEAAWDQTASNLDQNLSLLRKAFEENSNEKLLADTCRTTYSENPDDSAELTVRSTTVRNAARPFAGSDRKEYHLYEEHGNPLGTRADVEDLLDRVKDDDYTVYLVPLDAAY